MRRVALIGNMRLCGVTLHLASTGEIQPLDVHGVLVEVRQVVGLGLDVRWASLPNRLSRHAFVHLGSFHTRSVVVERGCHFLVS